MSSSATRMTSDGTCSHAMLLGMVGAIPVPYFRQLMRHLITVTASVESHLAKPPQGRHIPLTNKADGQKYNAFVLERSHGDSKLGRSVKDAYHIQIDVPVSFIVLKVPFLTDDNPV